MQGTKPGLVAKFKNDFPVQLSTFRLAVSMARMLSFDHFLGQSIRDSYEETFLLFSESLPSHNLGFLDNKAAEIELDISGRSLVLRQSPSLLTSQRDTGTTGAVLWKITPLVAEWLLSVPAILSSANVLHGESNVVEVGCGITGLIGILLAPKVGRYILTDQAYVLKTLHQNIEDNLSISKPRKGGGQPAKRARIAPLDWETDRPSLQGLGLRANDNIDLVVACDCIYNEYLIEPLVTSLVDLCRLNSGDGHAAVLVAQQLRSEEIFEQFITAFSARFDVWRVTDEHLSPGLRTGSGYAIHLGVLKASNGVQ